MSGSSTDILNELQERVARLEEFLKPAITDVGDLRAQQAALAAKVGEQHFDIASLRSDLDKLSREAQRIPVRGGVPEGQQAARRF